jgi:hypothetical protein
LSDEAIVATLAHEMHEINALRSFFEQHGRLSAAMLRRLLNAPDGSLHQEALKIETKAWQRIRGN